MQKASNNKNTTPQQADYQEFADTSETPGKRVNP